MKKLFLIGLLFQLCNFLRAQSSDEIFITSTNDSLMDLYLKGNSIQKDLAITNGYKFLIYMYPNPQHLKECRLNMSHTANSTLYMYYKYSKAVWYIKCNENQFATPNTTMYDVNDDILYDSSDFLKYQPVLDGSIAQTIYLSVCEIAHKYLSK